MRPRCPECGTVLSTETPGHAVCPNCGWASSFPERRGAPTKRTDPRAAEGQALSKALRASSEDEARKGALDYAAKVGYEDVKIEVIKNTHEDFWHVHMRGRKVATPQWPSSYRFVNEQPAGMTPVDPWPTVNLDWHGPDDGAYPREVGTDDELDPGGLSHWRIGMIDHVLGEARLGPPALDLPDLPPARTARKDFSTAEKMALIDEDGQATNASKLDLEGTHYTRGLEFALELGLGL